MPNYPYACSCGNTETAYRKVDERNDAPLCCGKPMEREITAPMAFVRQDICYDSPIDGRPITSMQARREDLARNNCREYDPGMKQDYHRRLAEEDKQLDKAVDESVDREIALMPARKRETLEAELINAGVTAEPIRLTPTNTGVTHG